jgi:hypothetical protein
VLADVRRFGVFNLSKRSFLIEAPDKDAALAAFDPCSIADADDVCNWYATLATARDRRTLRVWIPGQRVA